MPMQWTLAQFDINDTPSVCLVCRTLSENTIARVSLCNDWRLLQFPPFVRWATRVKRNRESMLNHVWHWLRVGRQFFFERAQIRKLHVKRKERKEFLQPVPRSFDASCSCGTYLRQCKLCSLGLCSKLWNKTKENMSHCLTFLYQLFYLCIRCTSMTLRIFW